MREDVYKKCLLNHFHRKQKTFLTHLQNKLIKPSSFIFLLGWKTFRKKKTWRSPFSFIPAPTDNNFQNSNQPFLLITFPITLQVCHKDFVHSTCVEAQLTICTTTCIRRKLLNNQEYINIPQANCWLSWCDFSSPSNENRH